MATKRRNGFFILCASLAIVLLITAVAAICIGHYSLQPAQCFRILFGKLSGIAGDWSSVDEAVLIQIRSPRILGAILVGACLSISGASYQSVFQNQLVSPDILGVSSGACIGAALGIILGFPRYLIMLFSFACGVITVGATILIPKFLKSTSNIMLVLSGIIVGGITTSIMGIIKYVADPIDELPRITYWTMGSLDGVDFNALLVTIVPSIVCSLILVRMSWWIDVISMGEKDAKTLGANVKLIRIIIIICSTLLTAMSVSMCGTIGWIGLVIPHFARLLVGANNTRLIPVTALLGAIFLLMVDTVARTIALIELPLSIVTGFIGAPCYAMFLYKQRRNLN